MAPQIRKATRAKAKLRLALMGPSGSGKTMSALKIAFGMGGKVGMIDTENGSGDLYAHLGDYDIITLKSPYTVKSYLEAIQAFEQAGYDTVIVDSLSHAWAGEGGLLDKQGRIAQSIGNSYTAWREVTPEHNKLVDTIISSPCNMIVTMRSKTEYVLEVNAKGKQVPRKVGMAPVMRDGVEYEFTVAFELDHAHNATTSKDRTNMFDGEVFTPDESTGVKIVDWLNTGEDLPTPDEVYKALDTDFRAMETGEQARTYWAQNSEKLNMLKRQKPEFYQELADFCKSLPSETEKKGVESNG